MGVTFLESLLTAPGDQNESPCSSFAQLNASCLCVSLRSFQTVVPWFFFVQPQFRSVLACPLLPGSLLPRTLPAPSSCLPFSFWTLSSQFRALLWTLLPVLLSRMLQAEIWGSIWAYTWFPHLREHSPLAPVVQCLETLVYAFCSIFFICSWGTVMTDQCYFISAQNRGWVFKNL